ncbi:MAG TPA: PKD domain-containing protein, partial [Bacteroidia bacterium]|nr:PKD domain-containing protein [Bacteroidia bacterium]
MKKLLLIALLLCIKQLNAQCSLSIIGDTIICSGTTTTLTASGATNYTWMPSSAHTATIVVIPTATTIYTVTGTTGTCTATNTVAVTVNNNPVLSFTATPTCDMSPVIFTNTTPNQGSFSSWHWDFGDGAGTSTSVAPSSFTYSNAGTYTVVLTATTTTGCSGTVIATAIVHPNPSANGGFSQVCLGNGAPFYDASTITNPPGINDNITTWNWNYGDGNSSPLVSPTYTYAACGVYTVSLTVTTNFNCTNTISGTDTIFCLPQVIAPASFSVCPGTPVSSVQTTFTTTCQQPTWGVPASVLFV